MIQDRVATFASAHGLFVMGATQRTDDGAGGTLILLGADTACWPVFTASAEYSDEAPDPLDRWSKRVIGAMAADVDARAVFPSDGPPYAPFIRWALDTGRFFQSPTGMMIHDVAGLMISIRGALVFDKALEVARVRSANPCDSCAGKPCVSACPVGALSAHQAYDVPRCKGFLDTPEGADCMSQGCRVRRACPVSQRFGRSAEQSAFHMAAFKG